MTDSSKRPATAAAQSSPVAVAGHQNRKGFPLADADPITEAAQKVAAEAQSKTDDIAAKTMVGDLRDLVMQEIKHGAMLEGKGFDMWPEDTQIACVERVVDNCEFVVARAVKLIRSENLPTIDATVESVTVKDTIKAVLKVLPVKGAGAQVSSLVGSKIIMVGTDISSFAGARDSGDKFITPDQPLLLDDDVDPETGEIIPGPAEEEAPSEEEAEADGEGGAGGPD